MGNYIPMPPAGVGVLCCCSGVPRQEPSARDHPRSAGIFSRDVMLAQPLYDGDDDDDNPRLRSSSTHSLAV